VRHFLALAHEDAGGFLNNREEQDVRAVSNHSFDQADLFISFLLTKDNAAFEKFCNILEKFGHKVWSQRLRDKAADADDSRSSDSDSDLDELLLNEEPSRTIPGLVDEYIRIKTGFIETCNRMNEPKLKKIKDHCSDLIQAVFIGVPRYTRLEEELDHCPSIEEIAKLLFFKLNSWVGFEFLDRVIDFFPSLNSVKTKLSDYKKQLRPVLEEKLRKVEVLRTQHPHRCRSPKGLLKMVVKYNLDKDGIRVENLIRERNFLALKLEIPQDLLQVISWGAGSLFIVFFTLEELEKHITEKIEVVRNDLHLHGILSVEIGNSPPILLSAKAGVVPKFPVTKDPKKPSSDSGIGTGTGSGTTSETKTAIVSDKETTLESTASTIAEDQDENASVVTQMEGKPRIMQAPQHHASIVQTYIDNINLSEHVKVLYCKERFRCRKDPRVQIDIGRLNEVITKGSEMHEGNLLISPPSLKDSVWERLEKEEIAITAVMLPHKTQVLNLRVMFAQDIHKGPPSNIVLATCDKEFAGYIKVALELGWQVDLWTWDGCFPKLMNHPKCRTQLHIHLLDTVTDSVIVFETVLKPSQFTAKELTKKLSESGAVVRVRSSGVERGGLCQASREALEKAARFPVLWYPITKPDSSSDEHDFIILFISTEGDVLCPLNMVVSKINKREFTIPHLMYITTFEIFKKHELLRCQKILNELHQKCKVDARPTHQVAGEAPRPHKTSSTKKKIRLCKFFVYSHCPRGKFCPWPHSEDKVWCPRCREYGHIMNTMKCKFYDWRGSRPPGHQRPRYDQHPMAQAQQPILPYPPHGQWGYYMYDPVAYFQQQQLPYSPWLSTYPPAPHVPSSSSHQHFHTHQPISPPHKQKLTPQKPTGRQPQAAGTQPQAAGTQPQAAGTQPQASGTQLQPMSPVGTQPQPTATSQQRTPFDAKEVVSMGKRMSEGRSNSSVIYKLDVKQKTKRPAAANLGRAPTVQEIQVVCHMWIRQPKPYNWKQVLLLLGVAKDRVEAAASAFSKEPVRAMRMALEYWRNSQGSQPPTWTALLQALVNANLQNLAMQIEDRLKKSHSLQ
jgi:hypothetical protein